MKPIAQMSFKEVWKAFCSTARKFKLSSQESMCLFNNLMLTWISEHSNQR